MRTSLASLVLVAGLASNAFAQPGGQPAPKGQPGSAAPAAATDQPATPPAPTAVPVPNLPILETKELEGGLIIEEMKIGDGYEVKPGDAVVAFYHGTLKSDGKEFDSAFRRGEPTAFSLNGVV